MRSDPSTWFALIEALADITIASLRDQVAAGAAAIQLFDSWAGALSRSDYEHFVYPSSERIFHALSEMGVPRIHFGVGTGELLDLFARAGADVVGVDWRVPLSAARKRCGTGVALQGNLDPAICLSSFPLLAEEARRVLAEGTAAPGYVFNLGHGVLPETDPENLARLVELVHSYPTGVTVMTIGVLVMSYGSPKNPSDIARYYTDICRAGRAPRAAELEQLERRYEAIGGVSPLTERTNAQILALSLALRQGGSGHYACYAGTKHGTPTIEDAIAEMQSDRVDHFIGLVLAPHYSELSVGDYINRAKKAAASASMHAGFIEHWHDDPILIALLSERVLTDFEALGSEFRDDTEVVFTAHSLPAPIEAADDPYRRQLEETAELVAQRSRIEHYRIGWQSAAKTGEPWLGPDINDILVELSDAGRRAVIVCPAGFVSDHLEVLYDLDIVAHARAEELGLRFVRTTSLNDEPRLAELLAARVVDVARTLHADHGH